MTVPLAARVRTLIRLVSLQASWTYERMQGVGLGVATEPLLEPLTDADHARAARGRSVQYFNAHPYLGGIAAGALARAELDHEPGERILRLRTALSGPLGALGDQLVWAGVVPATMAGLLVAQVWRGGVLAIVAVVIAYNLGRLLMTAWGLQVGLAHGLHVAHAVSASWLPRAAAWAGAAAAVLVGAAAPIAGAWFLRDTGYGDRTLALGLATALIFGLAGLRRRVPAIAFTLAAAGLVVLWRWSAA